MCRCDIHGAEKKQRDDTSARHEPADNRHGRDKLRGDVLLATELCGFGVHLLATTHAQSVQDMRRRPSYRRLLDSGVFMQAVVIELRGERKYRFEKLI